MYVACYSSWSYLSIRLSTSSFFGPYYSSSSYVVLETVFAAGTEIYTAACWGSLDFSAAAIASSIELIPAV
jgi:hypothetical protein